VAQIHLVAVDREDLALGVALLDLDGEDRLADLALERLLVRQAELILEVARQLLRQRARALGAPPLDDVGDGGDENAPDVDAEVAVELGVLGGDNRLAVVQSVHGGIVRRFDADQQLFRQQARRRFGDQLPQYARGDLAAAATAMTEFGQADRRRSGGVHPVVCL
jgi:hypothetical protein